MSPLDPSQALPNDIEAEKALLSAVMAHTEAAAVCDAAITPEHFYSSANSKIWQCVKQNLSEAKPIDLVSLLPGALKLGVEPATLAEIYSGLNADSRNFAHYLRVVCEKHSLRKIYTAAYETLKASVVPGADPQEVIGLAKSGIESAETAGNNEVGLSLRQLWTGLVDRMAGNAPELGRIPTGIKKLDELSRGGPRRGQMALLGALRHVGKTAIARQIALNTGDMGFKTLCFFAESSDEEEAANTMAVMGGIETKHFTGDVKAMESGTMKAMQRVMAGRIPSVRIDTEPNLTADRIEAKCRLLKATKGLDVVIVDYLQFMASKGKPGQNREQTVAEDARRLKVMARQLGIVIYVLIQLSDDVSPEDEPEMRHIRESRGPVNHADIVLLMSAPNGIAHDPTNPTELQDRLIWNRKWRGVGAFQQAIALKFKGSTQQFIS